MNTEQIDDIITQLIRRVSQLEDEVRMLKGNTQMKYQPASIQYLKPIEKEIDKPNYPDITDAPKWNVKFVINTSKGSFNQSFIQNAFTEKQAIYLARTHQLFDMVNGVVKKKEIEPKWKVESSTASKID